MIIQTKDLTGSALDWAVAKAQGWVEYDEYGDWLFHGQAMISISLYKPSTDWSQCGPLLAAHPCDIEWYGVDGNALGWFATCDCGSGERFVGDTCQQAICRAIVAAELGDSVDVPDELVGAAS